MYVYMHELDLLEAAYNYHCTVGDAGIFLGSSIQVVMVGCDLGHTNN